MKWRQRIFADHRLACELLAVAALADVDHDLPSLADGVREAFGDVALRDLERMSGEVAAWSIRQPSGARYGRMQALRQTLEAAVRWGYVQRNPAKLAGRNPPACIASGASVHAGRD